MSIWGLIATAGAMVLGSAINYFSAKETNEANKEIHEEDNAFNREERELTQAYNSPIAMIERGKNAGLNRMASIGLPASTQSSAASPIPMQTPELDIGGLGSQLSQAEVNNSSIDKNNAESNLLHEQAHGQAISNSYLAEKENSQIMNNYAQAHNLDIDAGYKKSLENYYIERLEHNKSMSPLQQSGQNQQNMLYAAQAEESLQAAAESRARVLNDSIRVQLESQEIRSKLNLNAAQAKMFRESAEKITREASNISFEQNMRTREQTFIELLSRQKLNLETMDVNARCELARLEVEAAGLNLEQLSRERNSEISAGFERVFGVSFKDVLGAAPQIVVGAGKFGSSPAPLPVRGFRP